MSKSYGNTIPLLASEAELRTTIRRIPTDSTPVDAPKDPDSSPLFQILAHFASPELAADTRAQLEQGSMGWGALKEQLFGVLNEWASPLRSRYAELMEPDSELDSVLHSGAEKARKHAQPVLARVRHAVGII
jgi:tryptophanyl-tRNA synthetase